MSDRTPRFPFLLALIGASTCVVGCVQRRMTITSEPAGALVFVNNQEIGRTPVTRDFIWYGNYDVQLRKEGYETLKTSRQVVAPWWQWPPIDLFAELMPWRPTDEREMSFTMRPADSGAADPSEMLRRADEMRGELQSSQVRSTK